MTAGPPRPRVVLATTNQGKLREVLGLLGSLDIEWLTLSAFASFPPAIENSDSFEGNACRKALHYARHAGTWALADDSGLEVDALGGSPGVRSARYAGEHATDAENNARLLRELSRVSEPPWSARFRCVLALAIGESVRITTSGVCEGCILPAARGDRGFGYDPHFLIPSLGKTAAELSVDEKGEISHRGQALRALAPRLRELLLSESCAASR